MNADRNRRLVAPKTPAALGNRDRNRKLRVTLRNSRRTIFREFEIGTPEDRHLTRLALDEAEAIAWQTGFPELTFLSLAEEKIQAVSKWSRRQQTLKRRLPSIRGFSA